MSGCSPRGGTFPLASTRGGKLMRPTLLLAVAAAGLAGLVPAAAQAPDRPAAHRPAPAAPPPPAAAARHAAAREVFVAVLSGGYEVPPVETRATGAAELTVTGRALRYRVDVDSLRDVTGVYLHIGRAGEEAPAVADLAEGVKAGPVSGVVAQGTLGPAALRETTLRQLLQALRKNEVYVTVHTLAHPGGELRGQLRLQPIVASR